MEGAAAIGCPRRMVLLLKSATYRTPRESTVMPNGLLKRAALPMPSAEPRERTRPPMVLTTQFVPSGVSLRIV